MNISQWIRGMVALPVLLLQSQELELDLPVDGFETGLELAPLVDESSMTPTHPEPGLSKKIECFHHRDTVYDLYLPSAYGKQPKQTFPLLLVQNPSGRPKISTYQSWAEERGVILVGLYKVSNGMKQHFKPRHWSAFLKDLDAKNVRYQKGLVMTVGMSGGSADGERFTRHFPDHTCGVIVMGVTSVPKGERRRHIATGLIIGGKDPFQGVASREKMWAAIEKDGLVVRPVYDIGRRHDTAPLSETLMLLDWMLDLGRLRSPQLSQTDRTAARTTLQEEIRHLLSQKPTADRRLALEHYLTLPPLQETKEYASLQNTWIEDLLRETGSQKDPVVRTLFLLDELQRAEKGLILPPEKTQDLLKEQSDRFPEGLLSSWTRFQLLEEQEWEAHLDKAALQKVDALYETFLEEAPFPELQHRAELARKRLTRFVK